MRQLTSPLVQWPPGIVLQMTNLQEPHGWPCTCTDLAELAQSTTVLNVGQPMALSLIRITSLQLKVQDKAKPEGSSPSSCTFGALATRLSATSLSFGSGKQSRATMCGFAQTNAVMSVRTVVSMQLAKCLHAYLYWWRGRNSDLPPMQ